MIVPHRIKFRDKFNTDFDLICGASFEGESGNVESFFNKETTSSNLYDGSRRNVHGYRYTDVMNVNITLIHQDYREITMYENRKIISWLTGSNTVEELTVYQDDSEVISYRLIGNIVGVEQYKNTNGSIIGYIITFENISPYAFSPVKTLTKTITAEDNEIVINCRTDVYEKPLYPKIQVTIGDSIYLPINKDPMAETYEMLDNTVYNYNDKYYVKVNDGKREIKVFATNIEDQGLDGSMVGSYYLCITDRYIYQCIINESGLPAWQKITKVGAGFEIKNTYYENGQDITASSVVTDCYENEVITIDADNRMIASSETPMRIIGDSFNWEWVYFVPGENHITVAGDCTITFQWVEPIKVGNV